VLMSRRGAVRATAAALGLTLALAACGSDKEATADKAAPGAAKLEGKINVDGSSTVFPIMEGVAEDIKKQHSGVDVSVGESGTGGGFEKFCNAETDISDASRPIKDEEKAKCEAKGVKYTEFKIASDGLSVVSNKGLTIDCLTMDELKKTFISGSTVKAFQDIKAGLPSTEIKFFTPGADSGTYDFFLESVLGKESKYRTDGVTTSEDDNILVQGIEGSKGGLGFFGYAYFQENKDKLNLIAVKGDGECVQPSVDTVRDGSYPLSRPLFVYVNNEDLARPEVKAVVKYLLGAEGRAIITEVGYVELEDPDYSSALAKVGS
jgi:phosphate transport system substrate-binding protein